MNNMSMIEEFEHKGKTVEVYYDEFPIDPREWDNLGTMVFFHGRYTLGDKHDFTEPEDLHEFMEEEDPIYLPVYMYDHSGIGISTDNSRYPYNCPWDSGMLGYIYVTKEQVKEEYGWERLTQERIEKIKSYLNSEVEIYHLFLQGRCYGFHSQCNRCGEEDSCWGFYGEDWKDNGLMDYVDGYCSCMERAYNNLVAIGE
jgi:hypothetical protein